MVIVTIAYAVIIPAIHQEHALIILVIPDMKTARDISVQLVNLVLFHVEVDVHQALLVALVVPSRRICLFRWL
jgi:hypothetical protein